MTHSVSRILACERCDAPYAAFAYKDKTRRSTARFSEGGEGVVARGAFSAGVESPEAYASGLLVGLAAAAEELLGA